MPARVIVEVHHRGLATGEVESRLERLHQCAEKELQQFLSDENPSSNFNDFCTKLAGLTSVTINYFDNLMRALENGLSNVDSHGGCSRAASSKNGGINKASRGGGRGKGTISTRGSSSPTDDASHCSCDHCTYANVKFATTCRMCQHRK